jgi:plasmid replication initiation protein
MTKTHSTPGNATLVAVDIAKSHHDLLIEATASARRRHFRLANSLEDFERLADYLRRLDAPAVIGSRQPATITLLWRTFFIVKASRFG